MRDRATEFLKSNGLDVDGIDREALLGVFLEEMEAGLAGRPSSLLMIPSYISIDRPARQGHPVVALDAGGTHLRGAVVTLKDQGRPEIAAFVKREMPGTRGEIGAKAFFEEFASFVAPLTAYADTIGFCFSYAAEARPDCDARLIRWSKQIAAPEVEGRLIGAGLLEGLARYGWHPRVVILNDTVATLLAGKAAARGHDDAAFVGFILGTGTNTAYVERHERIAKLATLKPGGSMAINVESGGFRRAPQSRFDKMLDADTRDPGYYTFEKMISGAYLGALALIVLREASGAGLFSRAAASAISGWTALSTTHLDDFCGAQPMSDNPFHNSAFSAADREEVCRLCAPLYTRAAVFAAVNIASAILKTGGGSDPARPVCVNVDGSTYYRTRTIDFQARVQRELRALLEPRGIAYTLLRVDDSPVIGAAVAGLMREDADA